VPTACFVDTAFWVALPWPRDPYHVRATAWRHYVNRQRIRLITPELVWWEFLNSLAAPKTRGGAASIWIRARQDKNLEILPASPESLDAAFKLYTSRSDKGWSFTDCHSFVAMQSHGLTAVLTTDLHFQQAGFDPLLRRDPPII
jgi:predicted nucleic acid-binding protein